MTRYRMTDEEFADYMRKFSRGHPHGRAALPPSTPDQQGDPPTRAQRIHALFDRWKEVNDEWRVVTLQLAKELHQARQEFPNNLAFHRWLQENALEKIGHVDRSILIKMGANLQATETVLAKTMSRSIQLVWREIEHLTSVSNTYEPVEENSANTSEFLRDSIFNPANAPPKRIRKSPTPRTAEDCWRHIERDKRDELRKIIRFCDFVYVFSPEIKQIGQDRGFNELVLNSFRRLCLRAAGKLVRIAIACKKPEPVRPILTLVPTTRVLETVKEDD